MSVPDAIENRTQTLGHLFAELESLERAMRVAQQKLLTGFFFNYLFFF
jgi:hypothetical protein